jgi:hypothetical protein
MGSLISKWTGVVVLAGVLVAATGDARQLLAGPDSQVSIDASASHMEMTIAADPLDTKTLVGSSIVETGPPTGTETHIYVSNDGGGSWSVHVLPEVARWGAGDPQSWFGADGTAYFATLGNAVDAKGQLASALLVSRSTDRGATWSKAFRMPGPSYDHEQAISDFYSPRFKGRTYLAALYGFPDYSIGVWHSSDSGRTWSARTLAMKMHRYGINVVTPVVLSDGTLRVFTVDFPIWTTQQATWSNVWQVVSNDGGVHFGTPHRVGRIHNLTRAQEERQREEESFVQATFPAFAADANPASPYRDRIYGVWSDARDGASRVYFVRSLDKGRTWSGATPIVAPPSRFVQQFQPAIAVNRDGLVAVTWFGTDSGAHSYREYAAISRDGGTTFALQRAISTADSYPNHAGNVVFAPSGFEELPHHRIGIYFVSGFSRWPMGGDYMGLTADPDGIFHALWSDGRAAATQAWTATFLAGAPPQAPATHFADVSADVKIVFAPGTYDPGTRRFSYAVRLRNISNQRIYGPLTVEITDVVNPYFVAHHEVQAFDTPRIYGATNGLHGAGATYSYANALGDFDELQPGQTTGAVTWSFSVPLMADPYLGVAIHGYVAQP